MSDPIQDLEALAQQGVDVSPLPASEVRRRGDRRRRRQQTLAAVGGVAAIALIVTPIAVLASGRDNAGPIDTPTITKTVDTTQPTPVQPAKLTKIPEGFPLAYELQRQEDGTTPTPALNELGPQIPAPCASPAQNFDEFMDNLGVRATYPAEGSDGRTLRTFENSVVAIKAMDSVRAPAELCTQDGDRVWTVRRLDLGEEAFTLVQTFGQGLGGVIYQFVRVGNAVLVTEAGGEWDLTSSVPAGIRDRSAIADRISQEMCVFAEHSCGVEGEPLAADIAPDFPLDVDMEADGGDFHKQGPSSGAKGVYLPDLCGSTAWPVTGRDRLAVNVSGPEYGDDRTVQALDTPDQAVAVLQGLRDAVAACPTEGNAVYDVLARDTGYDSFTFGVSYTDGLGSGVWQATRVGRGLLVLSTHGEGNRDSLPSQADLLTATTEKITPAMCAFTEAGC